MVLSVCMVESVTVTYAKENGIRIITSKVEYEYMSDFVWKRRSALKKKILCLSFFSLSASSQNEENKRIHLQQQHIHTLPSMILYTSMYAQKCSQTFIKAFLTSEYR